MLEFTLITLDQLRVPVEVEVRRLPEFAGAPRFGSACDRPKNWYRSGVRSS